MTPIKITDKKYLQAAMILILSILMLSLSGCSNSGKKISEIISGKQKIVRLTSNSMEPSIKSGSLLFYQKIPYENLQVGDIIIYKDLNKNLQVISRIIKINDNGSLKVKPDNRDGIQDVNIKMYLGKITK